MPKSSSAVRPSGITKRLPPWRSPWKMPWIIAPSMKRDHRRCARPPRCRCRRRCMPATSSKLKPVEPLHHQHPAGHQRRVRAGHDVARAGRARRSTAATSSMFGRLEAEVELLDDRLGEQLDQRRRVGQRGDRDASDEVRREPRHHPQVLAHERRRPAAAAPSPRPARRCAAWRRGPGRSTPRRAASRSNQAKMASSVAPRSASTTAPHRRERLGRHLVAALLELLDQLGSGNSPSPEEMIWPSLM